MLQILAKYHSDWIKVAQAYNAKAFAEDIVQEMYIKVIPHLDKCIVKGKPNKAYIYTIIRNLCLDLHRKSVDKVEIIDNLLEDESKEFDEVDVIDEVLISNQEALKLIEETSIEFFCWVTNKNNFAINKKHKKISLFRRYLKKTKEERKFFTLDVFDFWIKKYAFFIKGRYEEKKNKKNSYFVIYKKTPFDEQSWYDNVLFEMYLHEKSYRKVEELTGISFVSIHRSIWAVKERLKNKAKDLEIQSKR
jgi:RNA polymerase sigma factor (sigma-70 family)